MVQLQFEQCNPFDLIPNPNNTRRHTRQQIRKLQHSIRNIGFASAIVTDEDQRIIAGHARCDAAIREGLDSVPVLRVTGLTDVQKRTLALADNRISEDATWDQTLLVREFKIILDLDPDLDLTEIGFDTPEIDLTFDADAASSVPDRRMTGYPRSTARQSRWPETVGSWAGIASFAAMQRRSPSSNRSWRAKKRKCALVTRPTTPALGVTFRAKAASSTANSFRPVVKCRTGPTPHF